MTNKILIPYIHKNIIELHKKNKKNLKVFYRSSKILPSFVDQTFLIHNGKGFFQILVTPEMVGYRFGEFAYTKIRAKFKSKKKK